jgi:cysteine desulfurase/selenocysteine lyase
MPLDPYRLKADFPLLTRDVAYLDSASTAQKPEVVLEAMDDLYRHHYANVHRSVYGLAVEATAAYEGARQQVAGFLGGSAEELVFTRSATGALNLLARSLGEGLTWSPGDLVVVSELEHHSNLVPWQQLAKRMGVSLAAIPVNETGELQLDALEAIANSGHVRILAIGAVANALGTVNPLGELTRWAHSEGALVVVDAAQAAPHRRLDVTALDCDFLALSAHKLGGPSGVGALWGRQELLETLPPYEFGGEMISRVSIEDATWARVPQKFEAGTPPIAEAVGFGAAVTYLETVGIEAVEAHERALLDYALERLTLPGITLLGPAPERRSGIVAFTVEGVHPHDVAQVLDDAGVCVRAGHHCAQPLLERLGLQATTRASFWLYTTPDDIDRLAVGLARVQKLFGVTGAQN